MEGKEKVQKKKGKGVEREGAREGMGGEGGRW